MQLIPTTSAPLPSYQHCAGQHYTGRPSRALRRRMRTPEKMKVSTWAEKFRRVTEIDSNPGAWRNDLVPHLVKPMDTIGLAFVREVWICAPERAGKTQILLNAVCWAVDQGANSGNIFWLMPTEADARKAVGERIIPVLRAKDAHGKPGRTAKYLSGYADDTTRGMIRFNHGIRLFPAWANSPASMASYFGRLNIADECDKFPERTSEGTDPITLFKKRARDDRQRSKYIFASTPAGKYIYKGATEAHQVWSFQLRCGDCDQLVNPDGQHLVIKENATVEDVERHGCDLACPKCGAIWDEQQRGSAYQSGAWVCIKGAENPRPATVGFHLSAFCLPRVPLSEIGAAWMRAQGGTHAAKIAWANGYEAIDYEPTRATEDYKQILSLCDDRPRDLVPIGVACLSLQVDTQQNGFYYEVSAIGYADQNGQVSSWLVSMGFLLSFADIKTLSERTWHDSAGKNFKIISAVIDSGGTRKAGTPAKHSRTKEVYQFCKNNPLFKALKGTGKKDKPVSYTTIDTWPGTSKPIPGGLQLIKPNVHYYKDDLASRLAMHPDDPGAFVLYSGYTRQQLENPLEGISPDNELIDYAKHLCSEYKNELGLWEHDRKAGRNDYHDCATYRMYHIELLTQWGVLTRAEQQPKGRKVYSKGVKR